MVCARPGGLPVINDSDVSTDRLALWQDYCIKVDEAYEHKEKDEILEPFLAYNINTDFQLWPIGKLWKKE